LATGHEPTYLQTLKEGVEYLREYIRQRSTERDFALVARNRAAELMRRAVISAVDNLYGASVETNTDLGLRSEATITLDWLLPIEFADVTIDGIAPDEGSFELDIYDFDTNDETYLAHASINVELELDGFVHKADYSEQLGMMMFDPDWNDHYMNIGLTESVRLTWYVTVVRNSVEDISFDAAEPIATGNDNDHAGTSG